MAMRAVLKKITPPISIRFSEGRRLVPPYLGRIWSSKSGSDRAYLHNRKQVVPAVSGATKIDDQENRGESNKFGMKKEVEEIANKLPRLHSSSSQELKKEEQQIRYLQGSQWEYMNSFLSLSGFQTRQLVSMKSDLITSTSSNVHEKVEGRGGGVIEFSTPAFDLGLRSSSTKVLELHEGGGPYGLPRQIVNGWVCITSWDKQSFLLYNPLTGEQSPWIKTPKASGGGEIRREVECIALGFDQKKNEHKVVCVSTTYKKTSVPEYDVAFVVEVLHIGGRTWMGGGDSGESMWRRRCEVLIADSKSGQMFHFVDPPVYVDGSIYFLFRHEGEARVLAEFDVESECIRYAFTPRKKKGDPQPTFQLMEWFVGCVGVLERISDYEASVKIPDDDTYLVPGLSHYPGYRIEWSEETISLPCAWAAGKHLSIEALEGTNILFIQPENSEFVFCYDRNTKKSERFRISDDRLRIMQLRTV